MATDQIDFLAMVEALTPEEQNAMLAMYKLYMRPTESTSRPFGLLEEPELCECSDGYVAVIWSQQNEFESVSIADVIRAIRMCRALLHLVARFLRVSPEVVRRFIDRYPEVRQAMEDTREEQVDLSEHQLFKARDEGEEWASKYILGTLGRARGYQSDDGTAIALNLKALTIEQLSLIAQGKSPKTVLSSSKRQSLLGPIDDDDPELVSTTSIIPAVTE